MKDLRNKSILLIDDDEGMLRALNKILCHEGARVTCTLWAGDAIEALVKFKNHINLVITDLRMPYVTGMTVVYAIHEIYPNLPVIVVSAFGSPDVKAACREQGVVAFLEKPVNSQELLAAVRKALNVDSPDSTDSPGQSSERIEHE